MTTTTTLAPLGALIAATTLLGAACTPTHPEPARTAATPATVRETPPRPLESPKSDPAPTLAEPPKIDPPVAPPPVEPTAPAVLVATAIEPAPHAATWREVPAALPPDRTFKGFYYFATGILTGEAPTFYSADAAGTVNSLVLDNPPGPTSGHWPDEAWAFQTGRTNDRAVTTRHRLLRLRGGKRWVPQTLAGDQWIMADEMGPVRKSWQVGYLAFLGGSLGRVAGGSAEEPASTFHHGTLLDFTETKAGELFTLSNYGDTYYVQIGCADQACVDANATPLPPGLSEWVLTIPRQKHNISISLREPRTGQHDHLLHYETGGWKLEAMPADIGLVGLWPTSDGGLWAQSSDALFHRDPAGGWRKVALPADVQPNGPVFAAMTGNMSELWLIGTKNGAQVIMATAARAQAPG